MAEIAQDRSSFNEEFCLHLEYHLSKTFQNSDREDIRSLWCDGISWPADAPNEFKKESIAKERVIVTKAWIGVDGQGEYKMAIHLGEKSLRCYLNDEPLLGCIPSEQNIDWIDIDTTQQTIELWLD